MQYYTPSHCPEPRNGIYTPHRGSSYHGGEYTFLKNEFFLLAMKKKLFSSTMNKYEVSARDM